MYIAYQVLNETIKTFLCMVGQSGLHFTWSKACLCRDGVIPMQRCLVLDLVQSEAKFCTKTKMSLVVRKPVFGVSDEVRHKSSCTATEDG